MHCDGIACREAVAIREAYVCSNTEVVVVRSGGNVGRRFIDSM